MYLNVEDCKKNKKKKILLIATGGTIASKNMGNGLTPEITSNELLSFVPELEVLCDLDTIQLFNIDSTNLTPKHWVKLAKAVKKYYNDYDGFVITHGTDTLSYTAAGLSYMIQESPKPIVLTGSQKSIYLRDTDARKNLTDAVKYAIDDKAKGVRLVFNGNVMLGTRVRKVRTQSYNAFDSIDYPCLAKILSNRIVHYIVESKVSDEPKFYFEQNSKILVLKLTPGMTGEAIKVIAPLYKAIVIEAFGMGGLPDIGEDSLRNAVDEYTKEGGIVAITTQVPYEGSNLSTYAVGHYLCDNPQVLEGGDMTMEALTCKLIWILGQTDKIEEVKKLFYKPVDFDII